MWPNPQFYADLVIFTKEILNGKLHFLCSGILVLITGKFGNCLHSANIISNVGSCALRKNCPYSEFFWSVFCRIWNEYGEKYVKFSRRFRKEFVIFLFLSEMSKEQESTFRESLKFIDLIYRILKSKKTIYLGNVPLTKQFSLINSCCGKQFMSTISTGNFPYSLMCHYSLIDLRKKTSIPRNFFLELIYMKYDGK